MTWFQEIHVLRWRWIIDSIKLTSPHLAGRFRVTKTHKHETKSTARKPDLPTEESLTDMTVFLRSFHSTNKKKVQLTQGWRATAMPVWRPLGNKSEPSQKLHKPTLEPNITSIGKVVAKLWPFLDIQDGVSRHLGFLKFESCTIISADPENPTLEPNIMYTARDMLV